MVERMSLEAPHRHLSTCADIHPLGHARIPTGLLSTVGWNYLIDDEAISQLLTAEAGQPVPVEKIRDWISAHKEDRAYLDNPLAEGVDWAHVVDAPKLLYDLFNAMTDAKVEYQKTHHSVELTKWL